MISVSEQMFIVGEAVPVRLPLVNLGTLLDQIVYRLPGCSDVMMRKEMQKTARTFCNRTGALCVKITNNLVAGTLTYTLEPDLSAFIHTLFGVAVDDVLLDKSLFTITDAEPASLTLLDGAVTDASLLVDAYVSLVPHIGCEDFPDWFLSMWGDAIVSGTLGVLMAMEKRPWSDPTSARVEMTAFTNHMNDAAVRRLTGGKQADITSRNPVAWL